MNDIFFISVIIRPIIIISLNARSRALAPRALVAHQTVTTCRKTFNSNLLVLDYTHLNPDISTRQIKGKLQLTSKQTCVCL